MTIRNYDHLVEYADLLKCPACSEDNCLHISHDNVSCQNCGGEYLIKDDIPHFFLPNDWEASDDDVTETVKAFYEEVPFPNYEDNETVGDLIAKSKKGVFANLLNQQTPYNIKVLEVGCGTGQLSNFLGVTNRIVFGTDICQNSLKIANEFKNRNNLEKIGFYQMNLFRPIFKEESFHFVICNGTLHHTSDPFRGFESISKLVKKDGYILIGLYNAYGRIITDIRRVVFQLFSDHFQFLDPRLRSLKTHNEKNIAWFKDQYKHPHESKHTIGEVLKWFDKTGFDFVSSIPPTFAGEKFDSSSLIFKKARKGSWVDRLLVQAKMILNGSKEGGLFIMIGKKK